MVSLQDGQRRDCPALESPAQGLRKHFRQLNLIIIQDEEEGVS